MRRIQLTHLRSPASNDCRPAGESFQAVTVEGADPRETGIAGITLDSEVSYFGMQELRAVAGRWRIAPADAGAHRHIRNRPDVTASSQSQLGERCGPDVRIDHDRDTESATHRAQHIRTAPTRFRSIHDPTESGRAAAQIDRAEGGDSKSLDDTVPSLCGAEEIQCGLQGRVRLPGRYDDLFEDALGGMAHCAEELRAAALNCA